MSKKNVGSSQTTQAAQKDLLSALGYSADGCELRPILDYLRPVRVETWRDEGLFRGRYKYSVGSRIGFIVRTRSAAFDFSGRNPAEARGSGTGVSRDLIRVEKLLMVKRRFNVIDDADFREIMISMICTENMPRARHVAKKAQIPWPQFVYEFNTNLEKMMEGQK